MHAQLETALTRFLVDVDHSASRSDPQQRSLLPFDGGEGRHVEHDPALDRNTLSIVSGAGAAHRDRHAISGRGSSHAYDVRLVARRNNEIGDLALKLALQDGAEPKEIARFRCERLRVVRNRHVAERRGEGAEVIAISGSDWNVIHCRTPSRDSEANSSRLIQRP